MVCLEKEEPPKGSLGAGSWLGTSSESLWPRNSKLQDLECGPEGGLVPRSLTPPPVRQVCCWKRLEQDLLEQYYRVRSSDQLPVHRLSLVCNVSNAHQSNLSSKVLLPEKKKKSIRYKCSLVRTGAWGSTPRSTGPRRGLSWQRLMTELLSDPGFCWPLGSFLG